MLYNCYVIVSVGHLLIRESQNISRIIGLYIEYRQNFMYVITGNSHNKRMNYIGCCTAYLSYDTPVRSTKTKHKPNNIFTRYDAISFYGTMYWY